MKIAAGVLLMALTANGFQSEASSLPTAERVVHVGGVSHETISSGRKNIDHSICRVSAKEWTIYSCPFKGKIVSICSDGKTISYREGRGVDNYSLSINSNGSDGRAWLKAESDEDYGNIVRLEFRGQKQILVYSKFSKSNNLSSNPYKNMSSGKIELSDNSSRDSVCPKVGEHQFIERNNLPNLLKIEPE